MRLIMRIGIKKEQFDLLNEVIDYIEDNADGFCMSTWVTQVPSNADHLRFIRGFYLPTDCGTVMCFGGTALYLDEMKDADTSKPSTRVQFLADRERKEYGEDRRLWTEVAVKSATGIPTTTLFSTNTSGKSGLESARV